MPLQHRQRVSKLKNVLKKRKEEAKKHANAVKSWRKSLATEVEGIVLTVTTLDMNLKDGDGRITAYEQLVSEFTALQQEVEQLKGAKSATEKKKLKEAEKKLKAKDNEAQQCASDLDLLLDGCTQVMEGAKNWSQSLPSLGDP